MKSGQTFELQAWSDEGQQKWIENHDQASSRTCFIVCNLCIPSQQASHAVAINRLINAHAECQSQVPKATRLSQCRGAQFSPDHESQRGLESSDSGNDTVNVGDQEQAFSICLLRKKRCDDSSNLEFNTYKCGQSYSFSVCNSPRLEAEHKRSSIKLYHYSPQHFSKSSCLSTRPSQSPPHSVHHADLPSFQRSSFSERSML